MSEPPQKAANPDFSDYLALHPRLRAIVDLLAVNYAPLALRPIKDALGLPQSEKLDLEPLLERGLVVRRRQQGGGDGNGCHPRLIDLILRHLVRQGDLPRVIRQVDQAWPLENHWRGDPRKDSQDLVFVSGLQFIREIRIGLYLGDSSYIDRVYASYQKHAGRYWGSSWEQTQTPYALCVHALMNPFDAAWFEQLPKALRVRYLPGLLVQMVDGLKFDRSTFEVLLRLAEAESIESTSLALGALLLGEAAQAQQLIARLDPEEGEVLALEAILELLRGAADFGIPRFEQAIRQYRKLSGDRKGVLPGVYGLFHLQALLLRHDPKDLARARTLLSQSADWEHHYPAYRVLHLASQLASQRDPSTHYLQETLRHHLTGEEPDPWSLWFGLILLFRHEERPLLLANLGQRGLAFAEAFSMLGLDWLSAELECLAGRLGAAVDTLSTARAETLRTRTGWMLLVDRVRFEAGWERTLRAIENRFIEKDPGAADAAEGKESRLVWLIDLHGTFARIEVREQKRTTKGWSKGRVISLLSLATELVTPAQMSELDRQLIGDLEIDPYYRDGRLNEQGWRRLAGHPHVLRKETQQPVELVFSLPELRIVRIPEGRVRISLWPLNPYEQSLVFGEEGLDRIRVTAFKPEHFRLLEIIGRGFDAPESAHARVIEGLRAVSALVVIHSELGTGDLEGIEAVDADARPKIQLVPDGEGMRVTLQVRPFGAVGPLYFPGLGPRSIVTEEGGHKRQTQRDHGLEKAAAETLIGASRTLNEASPLGENFQWLLETTEQSLEFLLELKSLPEDSFEVEWPKGQKIDLVGEAGGQQFRLRVGKQRDWFQVSGELALDEGEVLLMQTLLELTRESSGRFVRLEGDRFLALTDAFRKRLEDLRSFTERQGDGRRAHPLALSLIEGMAHEFAEVETDTEFRNRIERLHHAHELKPEVPSTVTAELRDYQVEGYVWLSRLAAWGVGACLADDMGLGKTLQAIALIVSRAAEGPTLVVAPTSVLFNWHNEIGRFAPTLNPLALSGDRGQRAKGLGAFDVLIVSYGLLQQESVSELLAGVHFKTLILDEAQAIKNSSTRRSQSVMALQGDFRLVLTGTPLENHLGELWNLFRFINPGLLGSEESFNRRFAHPIERNRSRDARLRLKQLIQPFILRRTKTEVLKELPERTEIELKVVLGPREAAFYSALTKQVLLDLETPTPGLTDQRFKVLAAITKLRRACCNPNLVAPDLGLPSSKLQLLLDLLDELIDNRHKCLVFSQFVDHLSLVREALDARAIQYQYLDGQTPAADRKRRVESFQAGEGDVFLISLKAGGSGLNLTAADYVIHLDPWWNPAVEDQASSRAHRMGQERPVTVYRLVTEGTIEEQIVALHKTKRELAESLLEGGEISGRLDSEALMQLMRDGLLPETG